MKKLLYITANSKPEKLSASKTVGRYFVNRFIAKNPDYIVEELDLYTEYIPEINHIIFTKRAEPVSGAEYDKLSEKDKETVNRINALCDQFISADTYVIAAPMWSLSYPSVLKRYIDCIILNDKVIKVSPEEVTGLLDDKERTMVYIQSSGGKYPKLLSGKFNHGIEYFEDLFKFLGIKRFEKILVEGVDDPDIGREKAITKACQDIESIIEKLS
ncbi:MAG TPA: FMN-dependent NADH-azoreductase [Clostridiales bacterium]|nr:FMN-dependent NADH-azoreductase [Clostridiales bacterium]